MSTIDEPSGRARHRAAPVAQAAGGVRPRRSLRLAGVHRRAAADARRALMATGLVGGDVDVETAAACARQCALNALAAVNAEVGDLDSWCASSRSSGSSQPPVVHRHPSVVNGASTVLGEILGDAGVHARSAVGVPSLPLDAPVEVELSSSRVAEGRAESGVRVVTSPSSCGRFPRGTGRAGRADQPGGDGRACAPSRRRRYRGVPAAPPPRHGVRRWRVRLPRRSGRPAARLRHDATGRARPAGVGAAVRRRRPAARAHVCGGARDCSRRPGCCWRFAPTDSIDEDTPGRRSWEEAERQASRGLLHRRPARARAADRRGVAGGVVAWVTPRFEPRRFDAWFFVASCPGTQEPRVATGRVALTAGCPA
jgi:enamine deaminase RidA (YjgF/YER057c/UK114 family)